MYFILQALDCCPFSRNQAWTVGFGSKVLGCSHFTSKCGISELHSLYVNAVGKKNTHIVKTWFYSWLLL